MMAHHCCSEGFDMGEYSGCAEKTQAIQKQNAAPHVLRHVEWKMARTKKIGQMTSEATKEIAEKIDSLEEQASQGSFTPHGHLDVLTAAIVRPEHSGHVCAAGAGVTIKKYFGSAPQNSRSSSSFPPEDLQ
ncbi:hypothetical protein HKD37_06G017191 [Glycine soja]